MDAVALTFKSHQGSLAQYTRLPASHVVPRPPTLSPTEAAGLTLVGLTAYQALFTIAKLEEGQHLFVNGGSTAVGIAAIQLAKAHGARVVTTASGKNEDFVKNLGADKVRFTLFLIVISSNKSAFSSSIILNSLYIPS